MGEIIEILEEVKPGVFRIGFSVTGEERVVSVDPDKQDLFQSPEFTTQRPMACPFLRKSGTKKFVCSVHTTRPELCRQYSCYRILVLASTGNRIGRVTDASRYFTTTDVDLRKIWNHEIATIMISDERCWEEHVEQSLNRAGYKVVR